MDSAAVKGPILHSSSTNKNAFKALIAAEYNGIKIELVKDFQMGVSNKTPEFLKMNPIGKVPVLETPDGSVFESNAIARYGENFVLFPFNLILPAMFYSDLTSIILLVAKFKLDSALFGSSLIEYGHVEQWNDFSATEVDANIGRWLYPRLGYCVYLPPAEEVAVSAPKRALDALNLHLASNTFLVGHSVTLADIIMTCNLSIGFKMIMTKSFTKEFPHVERYFWTMVNQPNFSKILGEIKQAESVPAPPSKKPAQPKEPATPQREEPPKKGAKKEAKKEEPKPKKEEPKSEEGAEEEAPKPKPKNPLDLLPPSKMILDEWKRLYSNTKTNFREVAIKGFWDMYDPEGYSLWFCDYKYNDENTVSFVTLNKLFRGKEIPKFVMDECYDMELYEWREANINDEAQKERVNQMIEDHEPFEGEDLLDAKCFK
nr:elongation factor 1-gamma 2-like [Ipomoea batatas]GME09706.1 elongation factor 1-gamma 2-like [Ipomoea batatas]